MMMMINGKNTGTSELLLVKVRGIYSMTTTMNKRSEIGHCG
jgi:hypothetical protein